MHVLRTSLYTAPGQPPTTVVVREADVTSFSEILGARPKRCFLAHDVFEMPDGDIVDATQHAMRRFHHKEQEIELNMAISFFWNAMQLQRIQEGGLLMNPAPAPYTTDECRTVLLQLHDHPDYRRQTIIQHAEDGTSVTLTPDGKVKVG